MVRAHITSKGTSLFKIVLHLLLSVVLKPCCISRVGMSSTLTMERRGVRASGNSPGSASPCHCSPSLCCRPSQQARPRGTLVDSEYQLGSHKALHLQIHLFVLICGFVRSCITCHLEFLWIPGEIWPVGIPSSMPFNLAEWR